MQGINLENLFLIDIETVSQKSSYDLLGDEWKTLWFDKISKLLPDDISAESFYSKRAAIYAEFGKVICISFGVFKKEESTFKFRIKSFYGDDENEILKSFSNTVCRLQTLNNKWCYAGHNIKEFDIPFLSRRMIVNNIQIPSCFDFQNMKPWETPILDTLHLWRFGDFKNYTSLKLLAAVLGVPSPKDDIDGSQVGDIYWINNDINRIASYCQKDVLTVANIILRLKNMDILTPENIVYVN